MSKRNLRLRTAQKHGRRAVTELRRMTADSALYWVLAHRARIAGFRRAVKGTRAAKPFEQLLARIRAEATPAARPRKRRVARVRRRRATRARLVAAPFMLG